MGVAALAVLSLLPVVMVQLTGGAAAGISAGFVAPFEHKVHIALFAFAGLVALRRGTLTLVMLPLSMLLMLAVGGMADASMSQIAGTRVWLFACMLLFALAVSIAYTRSFFVTASIAGAFAFYAGTRYITLAPGIASPGYFLCGTVLAAGLLMAAGASIGLIGWGYLGRTAQKLQRIPAVASVLTFL